MDKKVLITALITNAKSPYQEADRAGLEALSECTLKALEQQYAEPAQPAVPAQPAAPAAPAAVPAAVPAPAPAKTLTPEEQEVEFLSKAPQSIRDMVARQKAAEKARRETLVSALKTAQSTYTEAELNAMPLESLEKTAQLVKVAPQSVDYSGLGLGGSVTAAASAEEESAPEPPDMFERIRTARAARK